MPVRSVSETKASMFAIETLPRQFLAKGNIESY